MWSGPGQWSLPSWCPGQRRARLLIDWLAGRREAQSKKLIWLPGMWRTAWAQTDAATLLLVRPGINFLWRNMKILSLTWQGLSHPCRSRCKRLSCIILNTDPTIFSKTKVQRRQRGWYQPHYHWLVRSPRSQDTRLSETGPVLSGFIWGHGHGTFLKLLSIDVGVFRGSRKTKPGLWCVTRQT